MNIYRHQFSAPCCNNGEAVAYGLEIQKYDSEVILVEDIQAACVEAANLPRPYHENIANFLFDRFGGLQTMKAWHHGTDIETRRGE